MNKISAGVVTGLLLGAAQGVLMKHPGAKGAELILPILGRASQGIVGGILTAYFTRGKTPMWQGAIVGAIVGAGLGCIASIPTKHYFPMVPYSAVVGLVSGIAVAKASKPR